jgi:hypothetical protein
MEAISNVLQATLNSISSPFKMMSPWKAAAANPTRSPLAPKPINFLDNAAGDKEIKRQVQLKKAFTKLRADITDNSSTLPTKKKKVAPVKATIKKSTKSPARVKSEPMRRSRRARAYKKGSYNESTLTANAWAGKGSAQSPIKL